MNNNNISSICFINPQSPFLANQTPFPPLGILYLAKSILNSSYNYNYNISIKVCDLSTEKEPYNTIKKVASSNFDIYAITSTTPQYPYAIEVANTIQEIHTNSNIIIGGIHPTVIDFKNQLSVPDRTIYTEMINSFKTFNVVVQGEGEELFSDLSKLSTTLNNTNNQQTNRPQIIATEPTKDINLLPAREFVDMTKYTYRLSNKRATQIMSARGCPFRCNFCCGRRTPNLSKIRLRTTESVITELDYLNSKYGYNAFFFHDDEFNISKKRTLELCNILKEKNYIYRAFIKAELFSEEIAKSMHDAGFIEVGCGIESGSQRILNLINKHSTVDDNTQVAKLCKKYDLKLKAFMIIGNLDETYEDLELTKRWLIDNKPDDFDLTIFTPYPGSTIYDNYDKYSNLITIYPIDFTKYTTNYLGIPKQYNCYIRTPHIDRNSILNLREKLDEDICNELGIVHKALVK